MHGKRVLITGGNSGIGLVTAIELARQGAELVLACREGPKTDNALAEINAVAVTQAVNIPVDLAALSSVRALAAEFLSRYDALHVLINNAGTFPTRQQRTAEGFELQIGVNHFAHFLLTHLLLDCLKSSAPARIVNVSSMLYAKGQIDFDSFCGVDKYSAQVAYNQSKLGNILFSLELAKRLSASGVTSNVLHPGAVATDIVRDLPWLVRKVIGWFFIAPAKGAQTTIMLASDEELEGVTGEYYNQGERQEISPIGKDLELREKFWAASAEAVGLN